MHLNMNALLVTIPKSSAAELRAGGNAGLAGVRGIEGPEILA